MPNRALRKCSKPGCHTLVFGRRCKAHSRKPWAHAVESRQARGYDAEYERNRRIAMARDKACRYCGAPKSKTDECDHVVPITRGGSNHHSNLVRACELCHAKKTGGGGRNLRKSPPQGQIGRAHV